MSYISREEFNKYVAEWKETIEDCNETFADLTESIKSLSAQLDDHEEGILSVIERIKRLNKLI